MWKFLAGLLEISQVRRAWHSALSAVSRAWYSAVSTIWYLRSGPRYPSDDERRVLATMHGESIKRELSNRSAAARQYEEGQRLGYRRVWRSIRPTAEDGRPPEILDPSVPDHVTFALSIVGDFDATREEPGAFADCLYRPVSDLPYPHDEIRRCCEFLIGIADAGPGSFDGDHEQLVKERDALGFALFSLDYFLDLPASEIPRQKLQNLAYVKHQYLARSVAPVTPRPGDIVRSGSGVADSVDQVLGVRENGEWMVVTKSGSPMQVTRNAEPGNWDEVQVIAPAAASWLTLTPPAGMPSWG